MYNDVRRSAWDMRARVLYGGAGRRVQSSGGASGTRIYWYDEAGQVIMESMQGGSGFLNEYLYVGGQRIARVANLGPIYYYYGDHLGTARVITDGGGTKCYDADYFPWGGEQHVYVNSCAQNYKFTGKERDPDTGSDYFGARWYRNTMARFYSPDWSAVPEAVPYAVLTDPQTLNLYSYVRNNPLAKIDENGHKGCTKDGNGKTTCTMTNDSGPSPEKAQNQKSCGFWCRLGQRLENGFTGQGFKTNEQLLPTGTVTTSETYSIHEPKPIVRTVTDVAGIAGLAAPETIAKPLGRLGAAASILNDPSGTNISINLLGLVEGFEGPIAITAAFNDFLDYGVHNNNGRVDKGAPLIAPGLDDPVAGWFD